MAFFYNQIKNQAVNKPSSKKYIPIATMNEMGCKACQLDKVQMVHPKMDAAGDEHPDVYMLGDSPTQAEDNRGEPFAGKNGRYLKNNIPDAIKSVRYNNIIRCSTKKEGAPELSEIECCRNYIVEDIERSKPKIIVGAGNVPLTWATGLTNVTHWRGKPIATKIGNHTCWYYPIMHPSYVQDKRGKYGKSEYELAFEYDWKEIAKLAKSKDAPHVYTGDYDKGITIITGTDGRHDLNRLEDALNRLVKEPQVGLDIETNSMLRPYPTDSLLITCAIGTFNNTVAFALDHPEGWSGTLRKEAWGLFMDFLLLSNKKVAHSLGMELEWLCYKIDKKLAYNTEWADTILMSHTLDERKGVQSLDNLTRQHFGFFLKDQSNIDVKRIMEFPLEEVLRYNGMDAKWTDMLYTTLSPMINSNKKYKAEYERKLRLEPALVLTQMKGVKVDLKYANEIKDKLETSLAKTEKNIKECKEVKKYETQFGSFSPTSPDHVLKLLRDVCKREEIYVGGGATSGDESVLNLIPAEEVPSAPLILEHRAVSKLLSTYVLPVTERKCVSPDGRIHTRYSSTIAETGRLASEDPNLQNYPKRKHKEVRGMIVASVTDKKWLIAFDFGQLEARCFAWATEDQNLVQYLHDGYDIHGFWTDRVLHEYPQVKDRIITDYNIDIHGDADKMIRKMLRDEIKNGWVFPQFFGASFKSCASNLKIPMEIANDLADEFWGEFTGVKKWQDRLLRSYEKNLYIETLLGRRRRGILTKNQIINFPIQGIAADLVTDTMSELSEYAMIMDQDKYQPILNVHDDLTFNLTDNDFMLDEIEQIAKIMCRHRYSFINVPIVIECAIGKNWYDMKVFKTYRSNELYAKT